MTEDEKAQITEHLSTMVRKAQEFARRAGALRDEMKLDPGTFVLAIVGLHETCKIALPEAYEAVTAAFDVKGASGSAAAEVRKDQN